MHWHVLPSALRFSACWKVSVGFSAHAQVFMRLCTFFSLDLFALLNDFSVLESFYHFSVHIHVSLRLAFMSLQLVFPVYTLFYVFSAHRHVVPSAPRLFRV